MRNGEPLPTGTPVPLLHGDRLGIAGVLTLEVLIGSGTGPALKPAAIVEVPAPATSGGGQMQFEASLGDMVTLDGW